MIECFSKATNNYFANRVCIGQATRFAKNKYNDHAVALCPECYDAIVEKSILSNNSMIEISQARYEAYLTFK